MERSTDKLLIQKYVKKGEHIIPLNNRNRPIAIAMENFDEGDCGIIDLNITYPISFNSQLIILPGLKKIHNIKKIHKKRKCEKKIYGKKRRSSSKKN